MLLYYFPFFYLLVAAFAATHQSLVHSFSFSLCSLFSTMVSIEIFLTPILPIRIAKQWQGWAYRGIENPVTSDFSEFSKDGYDRHRYTM